MVSIRIVTSGAGKFSAFVYIHDVCLQGNCSDYAKRLLVCFIYGKEGQIMGGRWARSAFFLNDLSRKRIHSRVAEGVEIGGSVGVGRDVRKLCGVGKVGDKDLLVLPGVDGHVFLGVANTRPTPSNAVTKQDLNLGNQRYIRVNVLLHGGKLDGQQRNISTSTDNLIEKLLLNQHDLPFSIKSLKAYLPHDKAQSVETSFTNASGLEQEGPCLEGKTMQRAKNVEAKDMPGCLVQKDDAQMLRSWSSYLKDTCAGTILLLDGLKRRCVACFLLGDTATNSTNGVYVHSFPISGQERSRILIDDGIVDSLDEFE
ncbi:hypothetical protein Tco_0344539 [Tanacetum coccineum]